MAFQEKIAQLVEDRKKLFIDMSDQIWGLC